MSLSLSFSFFLQSPRLLFTGICERFFRSFKLGHFISISSWIMEGSSFFRVHILDGENCIRFITWQLRIICVIYFIEIYYLMGFWPHFGSQIDIFINRFFWCCAFDLSYISANYKYNKININSLSNDSNLIYVFLKLHTYVCVNNCYHNTFVGVIKYIDMI